MAPIAICFFGITRSLRFTSKSISRNVLRPGAAVAPSRRLGHFFQQPEAIAVNGRVEGKLDCDEYTLLDLDKVELEAPGHCLEAWEFDRLKAHGDHWRNDFVSMRNLVHQLHSLDRVSSMALEGDAEICLFCRPDLKYHDSLKPILIDALESTHTDRVWLPSWQPFGGCNDRFAIVKGSRAIEAYGQRIRHAHEFCSTTGRPLHAERLLAHALRSQGIEITLIPQRASRVRASGVQVWESFQGAAGSVRHEQMKRRLWTMLNQSGLKPGAKTIFRGYQSMRKIGADLGNRPVKGDPNR